MNPRPSAHPSPILMGDEKNTQATLFSKKMLYLMIALPPPQPLPPPNTFPYRVGAIPGPPP